MLSFIKDITGIGNDQKSPIENNPKQGDKPTKNNNDPEQTTLLNQGTYGCVFRPGIEMFRQTADIKEIYNKNPEIQRNVRARSRNGGKNQKNPRIFAILCPDHRIM